MILSLIHLDAARFLARRQATRTDANIHSWYVQNFKSELPILARGDAPTRYEKNRSTFQQTPCLADATTRHLAGRPLAVLPPVRCRRGH